MKKTWLIGGIGLIIFIALGVAGFYAYHLLFPYSLDDQPPGTLKGQIIIDNAPDIGEPGLVDFTDFSPLCATGMDGMKLAYAIFVVEESGSYKYSESMLPGHYRLHANNHTSPDGKVTCVPRDPPEKITIESHRTTNFDVHYVIVTDIPS
jgi:hypothetical protein